jgi:hypothetical protein
MLQEVLTSVLMGTLSAALAALAAFLGKYLKAKREEASAKADASFQSQVLQLGLQLATLVVQSLEATVRPNMPTQDGQTLTSTAASAMQAQALTELKHLLEKDGSDAAKKALSMGDGFLTKLNETALAKVQAGPAPAVVVAAPVVPSP